ncbi:hypothetical protein [Aureimonas jatrophae]|uniref:hypothetical protein n=1 Tax=Aureimonas jatrophae TaxID=1166073 RepID=UPI000B8774F3|nr:hypothetical protein [Aureimonas jatrophae]MBB3952576.1 hypothetical protein [Aureimonas jatrophae]
MLEPTARAPDPGPAHQSAIRLLCRVHELYRAGYRQVRFPSGLAPSGVHGRCSITQAGNMSDDGLRVIAPFSSGDVASCSTGSQDRSVDWPDAPGRPAKELAAL